MKRYTKSRSLWLTVTCLVGLIAPWPAADAQVVLSTRGQAALPVVLGPGRTDRLVEDPVLAGWGQFTVGEVTSAEAVARAARTLADYLGRITGGEFSMTTGDGRTGIAVGLFSDFPELDLAGLFDPTEVLRREDYLIRSHDAGLYVIGATELAVQHAVWDLLGRLGYRQFFPGHVWEHVPQTPELSLAIDTLQSPSYHSRLIWYGRGMLPGTEGDYRDWAIRNRAVAGMRLNTSHEYNRIRSRHRAAFEANPDLYAMVNGERAALRHAKFNVANPELRKLVVEDAIQWFKDHPHEVSKSMDPSDLAFWDESEEAAAIGSPTDQALLLANLVAEAANEHFDAARYVGMYAYYLHQRPPAQQAVHPRVVVSFATRFLRSRQTVDELIAGWRDAGLQGVGIRAYGSVFDWDLALPSLSFQGASLDYLAHKMPHYHRLGARFYTSESSNNWGPIGLGHYVTARLLWDVDQAADVPALVADFLETMFGPAAVPMARFYDRIAGSERPLVRENVAHHLYTCLQAAYALAEDPAIVARLDVLTQYVRYVELFGAYEVARGQERQVAFESLMRHAYRMRLTHMIHILPLYQREVFSRRDRSVSIPEEAKWAVPEERNPWKSSEPFGRDALDRWVAQGIERLAGRGIDHARLVPRGSQAPSAQPVPTLRVRQSVAFLLHAEAGQAVDARVDSQLLDFSVGPKYLVLAPDGQVVHRGQVDVRAGERIRFVAPQTGTYRLTFDNSPNTLRLSSSHPIAMLLQDHAGNPRIHLKRPVGRVYFQVPAGVTRSVLQVAGEGRGERVDARLYDSRGQVMDQAAGISGEEPHEFVVTRSEGAAAEVWSVAFAQPAEGYFGDVFLELDAALPPVLSMTPEVVFVERPAGAVR